MDAMTVNRFAAMTAAQGSPATGSSRQAEISSFAEYLSNLGIDDSAPPKEIIDLLKMLEELEEKDEKKKKKEENASIDSLMETLRVHQEKMSGKRDTRVIEDKSQEAKDVSGQDKANFRDAAAKEYMKSLKSYIMKKYNIKDI